MKPKFIEENSELIGLIVDKENKLQEIKKQIEEIAKDLLLQEEDLQQEIDILKLKLLENIELKYEDLQKTEYAENGYKVKYTPVTYRTGLDNNKIKVNFPNVYAECLKETKVKSKIEIKID